MMPRISIAAAGLLLLVAAAEPPVPRSTEADARCLVATSAAVQHASDAQVRRASMAGMLFFLGRLEARLPAAEVERLFSEQAAARRRLDLAAELKACRGYLTERGRALEAMGDRLVKVTN